MHHATLYIDPQLSLTGLPEIFQKPGADVSHFIRTAAFSIDDTRQLKAEALLRPVAGLERLFLVVAPSFTLEAQNALLKLLEEPPATARFALVVPHEGVLLPTLRSRLSQETTAAAPVVAAWEAFRRLPLAARLETIADLAKRRDQAAQDALLRGALHDAALPRRLALLLSTYHGRRGASKKMLLEGAALFAPQL